MKLSKFDRKFIIDGTESETFEEACIKISQSEEYQACILEEYGQEMLTDLVISGGQYAFRKWFYTEYQVEETE